VKKNPTTTIPLRLELEYMLSQRILLHELEARTVAGLGRRGDADDVDLIASILGLTVADILDEHKLRRKLRHLAMTISAQKVRELREILGSAVRPPAPGLIEQWIDAQVAGIQLTIERWVVGANEEMRATRRAFTEAPAALRALRNRLSKQAEQRASAATLTLNTAIIEEVARNGGSSHYRWHTEMDSRVRPNHQALEGTIQAWATPPAGGGTKPWDRGHPGSGFSCRCLPEPIPSRALPVTSAFSRMSQPAA